MKIFYKIINIINTLYIWLVFYLLSFGVHIYTCYLVYQSYGLFLGIISFFCPIISTIIMFALYLLFYGIFNQYCVIILIYSIMIALSFGLSYLTSWLEDKTNKKSEIKKYKELANIVMNGLGINNIDDALITVYNFYKDQNIELDNIIISQENKEEILSEIVMKGLGTNDIDEAVEKTTEFYKI